MKERKMKLPLRLLMILLAVVFCVALCIIIIKLLDARHSAEVMTGLRDKLDRIETMQSDEEGVAAVRPAPTQTEPMVTEPVATEPVDWKSELLKEYAAIHEENEDFYGWIAIPGTPIDYPVMHTPEQPEKYLRRAFDGTYSIGGVPFLDGECQEGCGNQIIYGHNMDNGTMFAGLHSYSERSFWEQHPVIYFDTLDEIAEYEVVAAFYSRAYYTDEVGVFRYYQYKDISEADDFEEYMDQVYAAALYDTGVTARPGDQLVTLSTCDKSAENGRFVVVARKVTS